MLRTGTTGVAIGHELVGCLSLVGDIEFGGINELVRCRRRKHISWVELRMRNTRERLIESGSIGRVTQSWNLLVLTVLYHQVVVATY